MALFWLRFMLWNRVNDNSKTSVSFPKLIGCRKLGGNREIIPACKAKQNIGSTYPLQHGMVGWV